MTVVARLAINNYPLLIGDVLLSAPEVLGQSVSVPTIGNITAVFPEGSGFTPSGLRQKIVVVGDNLVIGWSGSRSAAKIVIRELFEKNQQEPFTNDSLMRHFENLDESFWKQGLGFVGFVKDSRGVAQFGFRYLDLPTNLFGRIGLLGSGTEHFEQFLQNLPSLPSPSRQTNDLERSLAYGLMISGVFLSREIATYESLLNFYGGGYEIASLSDGKFQKVDDITYLFWHGEITDNGMGMNLHQVCKYSYFGDFLLIRTAIFSIFSTKTRLTIKQSTEVVQPIYRDVQQGELRYFPTIDFNSKWLCNYYLIPNKDRGIAVFSDVHYSVEGNAPIRFIEKNGELIIGFEAKRLESIIKQAYNSFER